MQHFKYHDGPIVACSTGANQNSAISIIRLSGFANLDLFSHLFSIPVKKIKPRYVHHVDINFNNAKVDSILLTYFPGPASYNGENILELSVHGNILNIQRIIKIFVENFDFREAYPGEFTYRALKNKKMSLSQVEGLDLLLNSTSAEVYLQGLSLLNGELNQTYELLFQKFLNLKSSVELFFDFLEDVGEENAKISFEKSLNEFSELVTTLYKRSSSYRSNLLTPDIVLLGPTNAGKSTLFNFLVGHDRAIVSSIPGTTRDTISEYLDISGSHFKLVDTAGLRESSSDSIENEGMIRSLKVYKNSFFKILVLNPFSDVFENVSSFLPDLIIYTHCDLAGFEEKINKIKEMYLSIPFLYFNKFSLGSIEPDLYSNIINKFNMLTFNQPLYLERHRNIVNKIHFLLCEFKMLCSLESDFAIISSELNIIGQTISELIGMVSPDLILNNIFSNFCIGK